MVQEELHFSPDVRKRYNSQSKDLDDIECLGAQAKNSEAISINWENEVTKESEKILSTDKTRGTICIAILKLSHQATYLNAVIDKKNYELRRMIISSLNSENYIALGLSSRSLFEHAASLAYLYQETKSLIDKLGKQHEGGKILSMLEVFTRKIEKLYYGTQYFEQLKTSTKPINVNELVRKFGTEIIDVRKKYSYLCDFVHPNFGTNLMISDGGLGCGIVEPNDHVITNLVGYMLGLNGDMARYSKVTSLDITGYLVFHMKHFCDELFIEENNLNAIFSGNIKHGRIGSGKTQKDPIAFSGVETYTQYFHALTQYLENKQIDPETRRGVYKGGDKNYDVYKSGGEDVWFLINYNHK